MPISKIVLDNQSKENVDFDGQFVRVPHGTTAQRPSPAAAGQLRFNTDLGTLEQYNTNTNAWAAIDSPPIINSICYSGTNTATDPAGSETITINGSNFKSGFTITVGGTSAPTTTFVGTTQVTFTTPAKTAGDYDIVLTNSNGLAATLTNGISYNGTPAFTTAAGNVGSVIEDEAMSTITIVAAEPDGGTLAYSVTSGALPTGVSLGSANGQLTGTPNPGVTADTTFNFTVTATDDENQTNSRAFNLIVLRPVYPYSINQSLKFNWAEATNMSKQWARAATDGTRGTLSVWLKRGVIGNDTGNHQYFIHSGTGATNAGHMDVKFQTGDAITIGRYNDTPFSGGSAVFRDTSNWYHLVVAFDSSSSTASDREMKVWVNGVRVTGTQGAIAQNDVLPWTKNGNTLFIGKHATVGRPYDGLMAELHLVDGQALTPTSFASDFNGVWAPKEYTGSHGNNGVELKFATASAFGDNTSSEGSTNDFGTISGNQERDQLPDTPTNNFAVLDRRRKAGPTGSFREGNTNYDPTSSWSSAHYHVHPTFDIPRDKKIYMEFVDNSTYTGAYWAGGVAMQTATGGSSTVGGAYSIMLYSRSVYNNGTAQDYGASYGVGGLGTSNGDNFAQGDVFSIAVDGATRKVWFARNGQWFKQYTTNNTGSVGDPANGLYETGIVNESSHDSQRMRFVFTFNGAQGFQNHFNFGQDDSFHGAKTSGSAEASDENGFGKFYYTPPAGFLALCSQNITTDSNMKIADGSTPEDFFNIVTWSGAGNTNDLPITGVGFQPDFVWSKSNTTAYHHALFDSVRGPGSWHATDRRESANSTTGGGRLSSFDSDGFTWTAAGSSAQWYGTSGSDYLAWCWKAGGAPTATNSASAGAVPTSGSVMIDGVASTAALAGTNPVKKLTANTKSGFSIVEYTGNTSNLTKAHGLGRRPAFIIVKRYEMTAGWVCWHRALTTNTDSDSNYIYMDSVSGTVAGSTSNYWDTLDENVFGGWASGGDNNNSGNNAIAYIWAEIPGYSSFGRYVGNGLAEGDRVYTGFKPALVMIANQATNVIWYMIDNKIGQVGHNGVGNKFLTPSAANVEDTPTGVEFLHNGFKIVTTGTGQNQSATQFLYCAWAENPMKFTTAK